MTWAQTKSLTFSSTPLARIQVEHAVHHWDEFTADHLAYPLRKTREYAACVRLLAEWRAHTAMYEYTLEHIRAGRVEEALLPYFRPNTACTRPFKES